MLWRLWKCLLVRLSSLKVFIYYSISYSNIIYNVGQDGDFFYIVESGNLTIFVDNKQVGQLYEGQSFGELALLYNSPRNATIRSDTNSTLFALDRISYKYILAHSSASRSEEAKKALRQVPILFELTDDQFEVLTDSVELFSFNAGQY